MSKTVNEVFYTDRECNVKSMTVLDAIAAYKRHRHEQGHSVELNDRMLFTRLDPNTPVTTLQLNGLVTQALRPGGIPNYYDLLELMDVVGIKLPTKPAVAEANAFIHRPEQSRPRSAVPARFFFLPSLQE